MYNQTPEEEANEKQKNRRRRVTPSQLILGAAIVLILTILFGILAFTVIAERGVPGEPRGVDKKPSSGALEVVRRSENFDAETRHHPVATLVNGQRASVERRGEDIEEDSGIIEERIRLYKRRHGDIDPELQLRLVREDYQARAAEKTRLSQMAQTEAIPNWVSLGPTNGGGRISCIAVHPSAIGTVYVGADGGGVWKTTDGGNTWVNLTDSINNLNVGAIGIAPSSPNIVYVGTGSEHDSGIGLLKSTDGGNSWIFPNNVVADGFFRISVHPNNANELVIATKQGALRSTDGGINWTTVIFQSSFGDITDLVRDPSNSQILYAATQCSGSCNTTVVKSLDGGITWVTKAAGLPFSNSSQQVLPMKLAISPTNPSILFLSTSIANFSANTNFSHIYKTTNGGDSWTDLPGIYNNSDSGIRDFIRQTHHDNTIIVSPTDPNIVIAAGVSYVRTTDGGTTWSRPPLQPNFTALYGVHPDATDLRYQGSMLYIANDGGVFKTPDNGNTATENNSGLVIREYYALFSDLVNMNRVFAGSQDNGTDRRGVSGGTSWANIFGGDGFDSAANPTTPSTAYFTYQLGGIVRTNNANDASPFVQNVTPQYPSNEFASFDTTLTMDLNTPSTLYTGSYRVWKTTNSGDSWAPLPMTTTDGSTWDSISSPLYDIAVARSNSSVLMVVKPSQIFRSTNGGSSWVKTINGLPSFPIINGLEIDPHNHNVAYVATSDFNAPDRRVYMTVNGGTSWMPRGSGLPDAPVLALVVRVDPTNSNILYCGTTVGVYRSIDQGASWSKLGTGLPSINIEDMRISDDGSTLRIATYGRGVWELQVGATPVTRTLTVTSSSPNSGVSVTVSPTDNNGFSNGVTQFTRNYNNNTSVSLTAATTASGNNFQKWQRDGSDWATTQSTNLTMDANHTITAVYVPPPTLQITVQTNPAGRSFTVDGATYSSTQVFSWSSGSSHSISTTSPQIAGTGTQFVWTGWSDGGVISHTVASTTNTIYTANFTTQYLLAMNAGTGGTVGAGGYFNSGTSVGISASANSGYTFSSWTGVGIGSFTGTINPATVTMNGPVTETASFTPNTSQASYDPVLKAPKCDQPSSACNSGMLLNGRSNMTGGSEPNQPNTINNSCADGTFGTYHSDESLDAIKVSTLDGTNFGPGKAVRIDVTFWAWSTSSDYLDLFYAADANSPNWIHLLTVQPAATGLQVLTTTYQLPAGGSLQAVRASFRYSGSALPCASNSGYDDHDDLIFAIGSAPQPLQLLLEEFGPSSVQAATMDSLLFLRDPFPVVNGADLLNQGSDRNTRVIIFVSNLQLAQGETSSSVIVNLVDSNNQNYDVAAEDVRFLSNLGFTQVIFRLPNSLAVGTCTIKVKAHSQVSNVGTIRIRT